MLNCDSIKTIILYCIFLALIHVSLQTRCFGLISTDVDVCSGHGTCVSDNTCKCVEPFTGLNCETRNCPTNFVSDARSGSCVPTCNNISSHDPSVCSGRGNCTAVNTCVCSKTSLGTNCESCQSGFTGPTCVPSCFGFAANDPLVCSGHGTCKSPNTCVCLENMWTSANCSLRNCVQAGYVASGDTCEPLCYGKVSTDAGVCSGRGRCVAPNTCTCNSGFIGANCSIALQAVCFGIQADSSSVCSGHGTCVEANRCSCAPNWKGVQCDRILCDSGFTLLADSCVPNCFGFTNNDTGSVCSGHGTCTAPSTCSCTPTYTGQMCNTLICNSSFTGSDCSIPLCFNISALDTDNVCSGRGNCIAPNTCSCTSSSFSGEQCETTNTCPSGYTTSTNTSTTTGASNCEPLCFGVRASASSVCSSHGKCTSPNSCTCDAQYNGTMCELLVSNGTNPSSSNSTGGSCQAGYTGPTCSIPICFNIRADTLAVCNGNGKCSSPNNCTCIENWTGNACDLRKCDTAAGYTTTSDGLACEAVCFGVKASNTSIVCSGHGNCIQPNNCSCSSFWSGPTCSTSNSSTCSAVGYTLNSNGTCEPLCFGIASSQVTLACSGSSRGTCVAPNTCVCKNHWSGSKCDYCDQVNYTGDNCTVPICFGIPAIPTGDVSAAVVVCSGHGTCIAPNTCSCNGTYSGNACQLENNSTGSINSTLTCYGKPAISNSSTSSTTNSTSTNSTVKACSGHGTCVSIDTCLCDGNWTNTECQEPICFGIRATSSIACGGVGLCSAPNVCKCPPFKYGEQCTITNITVPNGSYAQGENYKWQFLVLVLIMTASLFM